MRFLSGIQFADPFELLWAASILCYGIGVGIGSIIGYRRGFFTASAHRSYILLFAGLLGSVALVMTAATSFESPPVSTLIATAIAIVLSAVFSVSWAITRRFWTAGILACVSLVAVVLFMSAFLFEMRTVS
ncbi:MAG: hypothetical protein HC895_06885 [Leptolyngbyaceae cyanobacterium SM1_3_5]|nr:hypothetical protein [Leptolyngbyaceae cyanobacterium SM1_3_5]